MSPSPDGHVGPQPRSQTPLKQSTSTPTIAQPGSKIPYSFKHPLDPLTATEVRQRSASLCPIQFSSKVACVTPIDHVDIPRCSHASLGSNPRCTRHQIHHLCACPAAQEGCFSIPGHSFTWRDGRKGQRTCGARQNGRSRRACSFFLIFQCSSNHKSAVP